MTPVLTRLLLLCCLLNTTLAAEKWTTSRIQGSPEPPAPYRVERAFPNLTFKNPLDAHTIPGSQRLAIVEQYGKIFSITDNESATSPDLLLDVREYDDEARETYGITFHPKFSENRFAFVMLVLDGKGKPNRENGTRIVRFKMADTNPPRLDPKSGQLIYTWLSGGHNGGNIRFGPDHMLYISAGDAEVPDPPDPRMTGQDISDALGSVLRIDVDRIDPGKTFGVPKDNPFINTPGALPEVWAYGFRNPWRLSFDAKRGDLWVADVGWELWEMVHRVERGGNYGWSITEAGKQPVHPNAPRGPTPIQPPVWSHSHDEAASITGGEVYYGSKLPELNGAYIYADWQFGTFWSLKTEGNRLLEQRELCRSSLMPGGFGIDPKGELIICDHGAGGLWRLNKNPEAGQNSKFPSKLSDTGLFTDVPNQKPAPGVLPYDIPAKRWADHATSQRWLALPNGEKITPATRERGMLGRGRWEFPTNSVLALTYSLAGKKIETQITHYNGENWNAYSYRWNDQGTDATLVGPKGEEATLRVGDREQPWKFFARSECLRCHTVWNNFTPGFNALSLDKEFVESLGLKDTDRSLVNPHDDAPLEARARSYLHMNCSVCHRQAGGGAVRAFMNFETPLRDLRLVNEKPVVGDLGLPDGRVIAPGEPDRSVLLYRMTTAGRGHMPYLGGKQMDDAGILLIRDWIASMPPSLSPRERVPKAGEGPGVGSATQLKTIDLNTSDVLLRPSLSPGERVPKAGEGPGPSRTLSIDNLTTSDGALRLALAIIDGTLKSPDRESIIERGAALPDPLRRDLFERFLPPEKRRKILGPNFDPAQLLTLKGDPQKGRELFTAICATCHRFENTGTDFGPDLTKISAKYDRPKLLEQIRNPGSIIDPEWYVTTIKQKDGEQLTGYLKDRTLKLPANQTQTLTDEDLKTATKTRATLMPESLLENLTEAEAAHLLSFLATAPK